MPLNLLERICVLANYNADLNKAPQNESPLQCKRRTIWHHVARNRVICNVARSLADAEYEGVQIPHFDHVRPALAEGRLSVAILVESVEHSHVLSAQLPGWTVLHSLADTCRIANHLERAIITLCAADKVKVASDVVINAMGGNWAFDVGRMWPRSSQLSLLVDLADGYSVDAAAATRARLRDYYQYRCDLLVVDEWEPWGLFERAEESRNDLIDDLSNLASITRGETTNV